MASIKFTTDALGNSRYFIHWRGVASGHGHRRIFKNIDEAALFFWKSETSAMTSQTVISLEGRRNWTLQKLIIFFLGFQHDKLNRNAIRYSTYAKCRYDLMAVTGPVLQRNITHLSQHDLVSNLRAGALRWIRAAFNLLAENHVISATPLAKAKRSPRKPITIPSKSTVKKMLSEAPLRERIACWLGAICGLRIGEALALTYADVSEKHIYVRRHVVDGKSVDGLKDGVERRISMPAGLFEILDHSLLNTSKPIIANQRNGECLGVQYSSQGELKKVLNEHGVRKFHHLRHFAVSRLADRGVDIFKISRMVGHSSIGTTMNIYGHLFGESLDLDFSD